MKMRNIFLILLILCAVLSISSVVASDSNDTAIASDIENQEVQPILQSDELSDDTDSDIESEESVQPVKETTKISSKSVNAKDKSKVKVTATVMTSSGKAVKDVKVTFKIDGKTYSAKTNYKGIATADIKIPTKTKSKTSGNILTKTKSYNKASVCTIKFAGNEAYKASEIKVKVKSTKKSTTQKYKIIKKRKTVTLSTNKYENKKIVGKYRFFAIHEMQEAHRLIIGAGNSKTHKTIKFYSNIYYKDHGKIKYLYKKGMASKHSDDLHTYTYTAGEGVKVYVKIKYTDVSYKKI